jgi:hypothetical protein
VAYRVLVGKPEGKIPLERCNCRRGDNIKMDHQELGSQGMDWINMTQVVVNMVMNVWVL